MKATVTDIKALPIPDKGTRTYTIQPGFYIRVSASGKKVFLTKYRTNGKANMKKLGEFDGSKASIDKAKAELNSPHIIQSPVNPAMTFKALWQDYLENGCLKNSTSTLAEKKRYIDTLFMPVWADKQVTEITFEDVRQLEAELRKTRKPRGVSLAFAYVKPFFSWIKRKYPETITINPCEVVEIYQNPKRERVLHVDELQRIWQGASLVGYPVGTFIQLAMLTCQRRSVIANMKWSDFEREPDGTLYWLIPGNVIGNKAKVPFRLMCSTFFQKIRNEALEHAGKGEIYLFPNYGTEKYGSRLDKAKQHINSVLREPVEDWRIHDFRRKISSTLQSQGIPFEVRQTLLGQKRVSEYGAMGHYNHYNYEAESNEALKVWEDYLINNIVYPTSDGSASQKELVETGYQHTPKRRLIHFG